MLRSTLNGYIRFAHRLSLLVVLLSLRRESSGAATVNKMMESIAAQPTEARERLYAILRKLHLYTVDQFILTSASMWLVAVPVLVVFLM